MQHKYLTIYVTAGSYADDGYFNLLGNLCAKPGGYFFEHNGKATGILKHMRIFNEFPGFFIIAGPYYKSTEFIDRLRRKSQMPHHRYAGGQNAGNGFLNFPAAFQFY